MEIDVTKCDYYFRGRCGVSSNINYSLGCYANDCYYKQLQQLKAENEELKENYRLSCLKCKFKNAFMILDEVEEYIQFILDQCILDAKTTQDKAIYLIDKIKQAKEGN